MLRPEDGTTDFLSEDDMPRSLFAADHASFTVDLGAATHAGKVRQRNEDHFVVFRRSRSCEVLMTNLDPETVRYAADSAYAMVVADGMGGAAFGDFASRLALQVMFDLAHRATSWIMKLNEDRAQAKIVRERVDAYVAEMQRVFRDRGKRDPRMKKMGTTWTSAHLFPPYAILVHIGDSRAYLWRQGQLLQATRDQTLAQDLLDAGATPEKVKGFRHVLTNSLSADTKDATSDVIQLRLQAGDRLLLCTDGLSDMVEESAIAETLKTDDPQSACDRLVAQALEGGGRDNITVVLAHIH